MSGVASKQPCSAFAGCALEALVDFLFGKLEDFLDANGHLGRRRTLSAHGLLDQKRVRTVAQHDDISGDLVFASENSDNLAVLILDELLNGDAANVLCASVLGLLGKPLVEGRTKHGVRFLAVLEKVLGGEIDGEVGVGGHQRDALVRNLALERDLVEVVGEHSVQAVAVDTAARHVLGTSEIAALNDQDRLAGLGDLICGNGASAARADDDCVEVCH